MPKFKFKLQPVLHHRRKKEDILKKELADIKRVFKIEKAVLEELKQKLTRLHNDFRAKQQTSPDPAEAAAYSNYIDKVERDIEMQLIKLSEIASEVKRSQERLIEASKDKKILEKLYDKQYEEFQKEFARVEQGVIDELATIRHNRKRSNLEEI
ncbi:MAG: flagellar export protein FliJ [Firmicutes bacterium]|nr:flagellar export protein FliJ [Bacillota bacterium]